MIQTIHNKSHEQSADVMAYFNFICMKIATKYLVAFFVGKIKLIPIQKDSCSVVIDRKM